MGKFNFKNKEDFEKIKDESEVFYHTIKEVMCPYFKEAVAFNAKGLKHLKFKSKVQARSKKDQYARFKLLYLVPKVLQNSGTIQGIWET